MEIIILSVCTAVSLALLVVTYGRKKNLELENIRLDERGQALHRDNERLHETATERERDLEALSHEYNNLKARVAEISARREEEEAHAKEKIQLLEDAKVRLNEQFKVMAQEALKSNNQSFLQLAKESMQKFQAEAKGDLDVKKKEIGELVNPIKDSLTKVDKKIEEIEKARSEAYGSLKQHLQSLGEAHTMLRQETHNLSKALRAPAVRGRWGEIQLRRVVEVAGMLNYCDFVEQESGSDSRLRPDLIVKLPNNKNVVIDSKAPLQAYLEALECDTEEQKIAKLQEHAKHIRSHLTLLSKKNYWEQFQPTPEFVVMFLPGEIFFSAALEQDPSLIETGIDQRVILATPTTLIALLRAVAYGWRQEQLAENAQVISELGKELYDRLHTLGSHFSSMKSGLDRTIDSYNKAVGSFESRVLVSARKFKELGSGSGKELDEYKSIEKAPRDIQANIE